MTLQADVWGALWCLEGWPRQSRCWRLGVSKRWAWGIRVPGSCSWCGVQGCPGEKGWASVMDAGFGNLETVFFNLNPITVLWGRQSQAFQCVPASTLQGSEQCFPGWCDHSYWAQGSQGYRLWWQITSPLKWGWDSGLFNVPVKDTWPHHTLKPCRADTLVISVPKQTCRPTADVCIFHWNPLLLKHE